MKCCSQGKSLTLTSACDLGETCHLCLFLLHAVIAQGVALLQQAHACTKFHHCFQHTQRQLNFSTYLTPRGAIKSGVRTPSPSLLSHGCKPFGAYSHLVTISKILSDFCGRFFFSIADKFHSQCRTVPNPSR